MNEAELQKTAEAIEEHPMREEWIRQGRQAAKLCLAHHNDKYDSTCEGCVAAAQEIAAAFERGRTSGHQEAEDYRGWLPTAKNINALPEPVRRFVHDIETNCDPAGMVRENVLLRDRNLELQNLLKYVRREENEAWQNITKQLEREAQSLFVGDCTAQAKRACVVNTAREIRNQGRARLEGKP